MIGTAVLTSSFSTANSVSTYATASISPTANSVLVASLVYVVTGGATDTVAGLSLTWTERATRVISASTRITVWTAPAGASPGSGALTFTHSANGATQSGTWDVIEVTGADAAAPVVQAVTANATSTAPTVNFAAAGNAANRMFAFIGTNSNPTTTPRPSPAWTELTDHGVDTPSCTQEVQWLSTATDTVADGTLSGSASWGIAGLEIKAASSLFPPGQIAGDRAALIRRSVW